VKATRISASVANAVATSDVGASGTATGVTLTASEAAPLPMLLMARRRMAYGVPFVRPLITIGDAAEAGLRTVHVDPSSSE